MGQLNTYNLWYNLLGNGISEHHHFLKSLIPASEAFESATLIWWIWPTSELKWDKNIYLIILNMFYRGYINEQHWTRLKDWWILAMTSIFLHVTGPPLLSLNLMMKFKFYVINDWALMSFWILFQNSTTLSIKTLRPITFTRLSSSVSSHYV